MTTQAVPAASPQEASFEELAAQAADKTAWRIAALMVRPHEDAAELDFVARLTTSLTSVISDLADPGRLVLNFSQFPPTIVGDAFHAAGLTRLKDAFARTQIHISRRHGNVSVRISKAFGHEAETIFG